MQSQRSSPHPATASGPQTPQLRASLGPYGLGELLLRIAERELTGRLTFGGQSVERTLFFVAGHPVCCRSSLFSERLGALGVRHGYFGREDVRNALALSAEHGRELGRALLELDCIDGVALFCLLSQQLMGQLASAAGPSEGRATFDVDPHAGDQLVVLRTHALTATLAAIRALTLEERGLATRRLQDQQVIDGTLPEPAKAWLREIGYAGSPEGLVAGGPSVAGVRARLVARMRPFARRAFDPATLPHPDGPVTEVAGIPAPELAELITLTLLTSRALCVEPGSPGEPGARAADEGHRSPGAVLAHAIEAASWRPPYEIPETLTVDDDVPSALHEAHRAYLVTERGDEESARINAWGPAAEADRRDEALNPVLTLYLAVKAELSPEAVLGVQPGASDSEVRDAYLGYGTLLAHLRGHSTSLLSRSKVIELQATMDRAFLRLLPGTPLPDRNPINDSLALEAAGDVIGQALGATSRGQAAGDQNLSLHDLDVDVEDELNGELGIGGDLSVDVDLGIDTVRGLAPVADRESASSVAASPESDEPLWPKEETTPTEFFESVAAFEAAHDEPSPDTREDRTLTRRRLSPATGQQASVEESLAELTTRAEALLVQGKWQAVLDSLEARQKHERLPPALRMALAIAQREEAQEEVRASQRRWPLVLLALCLGALLGWFARGF